MKISIRTSAASLTALLLILSGCATAPDYAPPDLSAVATEWGEGGSVFKESRQAAPFANWNDPQLAALVALAAAENRDLARARANLDEAVARRGLARSALFPQVGGETSAARQRASESGGLAGNLPPGSFDPVQTLYAAGLNASWELDLFGYNRRQVVAADARLEATAAQLDAVRLAIEAETALAYIEWAALAEALALAEERRELQDGTYQIVRTRVETGLADPLADRSARRDLRLAEAEIPDLRAGLAAAQYRLAVLTGQTPESFRARQPQPANLPAPETFHLPASLPAEILRARPDVRTAERQLAAAYADLGVAEADFYPRLRLTGGVGWESGEADDLFSSAARTWLIRPSIHVPVFQGGRLRAQRAGAEARRVAALAAYENTVFAALADVETVLAAHLGAAQRAASLAAAAEDARAAESRAARLYDTGLTDLETFLTARRLRSQTDTLLLLARADLLSQSIRYHKAFGGE